MSNALSPLPDLPPLPALDTPVIDVALSKRAKAAIVVRMMVAAGAELSLADFPENVQIELTQQLAQLTPVDDNTINAVIEEFLNEIEGGGIAFPKGLEESLSVLEKTLSPSLINQMRRKGGITFRGDPWTRLSALDNERLAGLLESESIEVGAVLLSKMSVGTAAELLGMIPGERARRITYGISQIGAVSPKVVRR
ncbi:MAG: flagellar motor switch protein FliG, partial [Pseudomonadota bacterium]